MNATSTMNESRTSTQANPRDNLSRRLDGWKEIAVHLNRSARCVQRWERNLNLPVHRIRHLDGSTVYAYVAELEAWRRNRDLTPAFEQDAAVTATVSPEPPSTSVRTGRWTAPFLTVCRLFLRQMPMRGGRS